MRRDRRLRAQRHFEPRSAQPTVGAARIEARINRNRHMHDKVFIEGLEIDTLIGIYDWERRIRQTLVFDIEMAFDNRIPAASDDIALTLNYKDVSKRLIDYVSQSGFGLVETLAERCAEIILGEFNVSHVRLKLSKPGAVRGARAVGVIIERSKA
jgi:7,8-dihydroneopterin aldolase/epimerase/oxygenase